MIANEGCACEVRTRERARKKRLLDPVATVIAGVVPRVRRCAADTTLDDHGPTAARLRGSRWTVIAKIVT